MEEHLREHSVSVCHNKRITGIELHRDGGLFTTSSLDDRIKVWDREEMQCVYEFYMQEPVLCHALGESLIAAGSHSKVVRLADLASGSMTHTLFGHNQGISSVKWMPGRDKILASASLDGSIRIWDVRMANAELYTLHHAQRQYPKTQNLNSSSSHGWGKERITGSAYPNGLVFSTDGSTLYASGSDGRISAWSIYSGQPDPSIFTQKVYQHTNRGVCKSIQMVINKHGLLFHPSDDGGIFIYDMSVSGAGSLLSKIDGHLSATFCLGLDANDRLFSASIRDGLYKWDYSKPSSHSASSALFLPSSRNGSQGRGGASSFLPSPATNVGLSRGTGLDDLILGEWDD